MLKTYIEKLQDTIRNTVNSQVYVVKNGKKIAIVSALIDSKADIKKDIVFVMEAKTHTLSPFQRMNLFYQNESVKHSLSPLKTQFGKIRTKNLQKII